MSAVSFISALQRGWSPPALLEALERLAERPLTGRERDLLRRWAGLAGKMTVHYAALLETTAPEIIARLASTRRGRALIHRTLSPRAAVVDPHRLDLLARRLTEQEGFPPQIVSSKADETSSKQARKRKQKRDAGRRGEKPPPNLPADSLLPASYSHLWVAIQVYERLGRHIRLPVRMPQTLLDHLTAAASPAELAAAETAADQTLEALRDLLDGRPPFPVWYDEGLPEEESLAVIEAALAGGQALEMEYYAAGTDRITHRTVEPYRIERRGDTPYLIGFCHLAQAERTFRLDRIRSIEVVSGQR